MLVSGSAGSKSLPIKNLNRFHFQASAQHNTLSTKHIRITTLLFIIRMLFVIFQKFKVPTRQETFQPIPPNAIGKKRQCLPEPSAPCTGSLSTEASQLEDTCPGFFIFFKTRVKPSDLKLKNGHQ
jgi:hypothetical protein